MADEITSGYTKQICRNKGGLKSVIHIPVDEITTLVVDATGVITALVSEKTVFRFTLDVNSGELNQTPTGDRDAGSYHVPMGGLIMLKDDELDTDQKVNTLVQSYYLVIGEYRNGKAKAFGVVNGLTVTTAEGSSGQQGIDMNGWTINYAGDEDDVAAHITDAAIIVALLAPHS